MRITRLDRFYGNGLYSVAFLRTKVDRGYAFYMNDDLTRHFRTLYRLGDWVLYTEI